MGKATKSFGLIPRPAYTFDHLWFPCHDAAAAATIAYHGQLGGEPVAGTLSLAGTTGALFDGNGNMTPAGNNAAFLESAAALDFLSMQDFDGTLVVGYRINFPTDKDPAAELGIIQLGSQTDGIVFTLFAFSGNARPRCRYNMPGVTDINLDASPFVLTATQYTAMFALIPSAGTGYATSDGGTTLVTSTSIPATRNTKGTGYGISLFSRRTGTTPSDFINASTDAVLSEIILARVPRAVGAAEFQELARQYKGHPREHIRGL